MDMKRLFILSAVSYVIILFFSCTKKETPEQVTEKFVKYVASGEFDKASEISTGQALQMIQMIKSFSQMPGATVNKKPIDSVNVKSVTCEVKDNTATCNYVVLEPDGEKKGYVQLSKEDGKWKVSYMPKEEKNNDAQTDITISNDTIPDNR